MIIYAIDTATRSGWACGGGGGNNPPPEFGWMKLPSTGDDIGTFLKLFDQWLYKELTKHQPDVVAFEAPLFLMQSKCNITTARKLFGLTGVVEMRCSIIGIEAYECHQQSVKKHFTGRGNFSKSTEPYPMEVACHERGWMVENHDVADACAIWDYAQHILAPEDARNTDPLAVAAGGWW